MNNDTEKRTETHACDCISRQAAITAIQKAYADTEGGADKCAVWKNVGLTNALHIMQDLPSAQPEKCEDAVSREEAKWVVFCHRDHVEDQANAIDELPSVRPSAQPEIIRCGQCKYAEVADSEDSQDGYTCQFHRGSIWFSGSYCSWAERKQDG